MTTLEYWPLLFAALCAALLMPLVIRARSIGHDDDFTRVQRIHAVPTSRLGGGIVFIAYLATLAWAMPANHVGLSPAVMLAFSSLPVVVVGLWEDIGGRVHPWHRLTASVISAMLASWLAAGVIARLDLGFIDGWLRYPLLVLPLTWFMVAGACNAINLIDGAHGLAGGTALMMFAGLGAVAWHSGDGVVLGQAIAMAGAIAGFLVWNYPRGRVFLGDAGAYFLGFMYAELSIQIVANNPGVSAWFVVALGAYPIVETLYSIYRRKIVLRTAPMQPDAAHLHSLVFRSLASYRGRGSPTHTLAHANARVAPRMWIHGMLCLLASLLLYNHTIALIAFLVVYCGYYVASYVTHSHRRPHAVPAPRTLTQGVEESAE